MVFFPSLRKRAWESPSRPLRSASVSLCHAFKQTVGERNVVLAYSDLIPAPTQHNTTSSSFLSPNFAFINPPNSSLPSSFHPLLGFVLPLVFVRPIIARPRWQHRLSPVRCSLVPLLRRLPLSLLADRLH